MSNDLKPCAFNQVRKTYFRISRKQYSCIDKTFAYTAAGNLVNLYLVYHGSSAKNNDPTFSTDSYYSGSAKPKKQSRLDEDVAIEHQDETIEDLKVYFKEICTYDLQSVSDRLRLYVNMFFIAEICHRLSKNFQPCTDFVNNFVVSTYFREIKTTHGNRTCIKLNLNKFNLIK